MLMMYIYVPVKVRASHLRLCVSAQQDQWKSPSRCASHLPLTRYRAAYAFSLGLIGVFLLQISVLLSTLLTWWLLSAPGLDLEGTAGFDLALADDSVYRC